jgi:hypothetical protein
METLDLNAQRISNRFHQSEVAAALLEVGIASPEALLATWITGRDGLETYAGDTRPVTDDQPRIEYSDWVHADELQRVLPELISLRTDPPVRGASDAFLRTMAAERQRLMLFYQAVLNGQSGYPELWARDMRRVLASDGSNAYYNWLSGSQ